MSERNLIEWVTDNLLLLQLCSIASLRKSLLETRMQKIVFLTQADLWQNKVGGFDYNFEKWDHGPFSMELRDDQRQLRQTGLLSYTQRGFRVRPRGIELLKEFNDMFERNTYVVDKIQKYSDNIMEFTKKEFKKMLDFVYSKPNPLSPYETIKETDHKSPLLNRTLWKETINPFDISKEEADSLEILLNPKLSRLLKEGRTSVQNEPLIELK